MAEHRVKQNNIIYIIPDDNLFEKWMHNEAFIDEYGRLINRKPHRVLKELKHYVEKMPPSQPQSAPLTQPARQHSPVTDYLKETVRDVAAEAAKPVIDYAVDKFFYEVIPNVWHEHIVPIFHKDKHTPASTELKINSVQAPLKATQIVATKQQSKSTISPEEAILEKRKVLYHWLEMLKGLNKLQNAGELDIDSALAELTNPTMLKTINGYLNENPNLLETNKYIALREILGRDLYKNEKLDPIKAEEIVTIAQSNGHTDRA